MATPQKTRPKLRMEDTNKDYSPKKNYPSSQVLETIEVVEFSSRWKSLEEEEEEFHKETLSGETQARLVRAAVERQRNTSAWDSIGDYFFGPYHQGSHRNG